MVVEVVAGRVVGRFLSVFGIMGWWEGSDETRVMVAPGKLLLSLFTAFQFFHKTTELHFYSNFYLLHFLAHSTFLYAFLNFVVSDAGSTENGVGRYLSLRHPKSGNLQNPPFIFIP